MIMQETSCLVSSKVQNQLLANVRFRHVSFKHKPGIETKKTGLNPVLKQKRPFVSLDLKPKSGFETG